MESGSNKCIRDRCLKAHFEAGASSLKHVRLWQMVRFSVFLSSDRLGLLSGVGIVVVPRLPKPVTRVQFPYPAPDVQPVLSFQFSAKNRIHGRVRVPQRRTHRQQAATGKVIVGVISDTHGRMHPDAMDALRGSDVILHAGDIGTEDILAKLRQIAPVRAITGNIDHEPLTSKYPATDVVEIAGRSLYMVHNLRALDLNPKAAGFAAVISGHSHEPEFYFEDDVLFFNPGSAGPRRFSLPIAVGKIRIEDGELWPEIVTLKD